MLNKNEKFNKRHFVLAWNLLQGVDFTAALHHLILNVMAISLIPTVNQVQMEVIKTSKIKKMPSSQKSRQKILQDQSKWRFNINNYDFNVSFQYFSHVPPSQGGKYSGFGNSAYVQPARNSASTTDVYDSLVTVSLIYYTAKDAVQLKRSESFIRLYTFFFL